MSHTPRKPEVSPSRLWYKEVNRTFYTVTWHVDDLKASHEDRKVNDAFAEWCENTYGSDEPRLLGNDTRFLAERCYKARHAILHRGDG
jgi:hypothetical protein